MSPSVWIRRQTPKLWRYQGCKTNRTYIPKSRPEHGLYLCLWNSWASSYVTQRTKFSGWCVIVVVYLSPYRRRPGGSMRSFLIVPLKRTVIWYIWSRQRCRVKDLSKLQRTFVSCNTVNKTGSQFLQNLRRFRSECFDFLTFPTSSS